MSPIFSGDLAEAKAVNPPLDKGMYTFEVGEPQVFARQNRKNEEIYGIKFPLRVADGEKEGRLIFFDTYFHTQGGIDAAKRFAMAVMGYKNDAKGEADFNTKCASDSDKEAMIIDFDERELGSFWKGLGGKNVVGDIDITTNNFEGVETLQQKYKKWLPYGG